MLYRTHVVSSLAVGTALVVATDYPYTADLVAGLMIGSVLPDIDEPNSFIGRRSFGLSKLINRLFGHRGFTHSLTCWIMLAILSLLYSNTFTISISLGYLFHLMGDLFSTSGLRLFLPFSEKRVKMFITYQTGGTREKMIFYLCIVLIMFFVLQNERLLENFSTSTADWILYFLNKVKNI